MQGHGQPGWARWIFGLITVIGAVIAFSVYQSYSKPAPQTVSQPPAARSLPTLPSATAVKSALKPTAVPTVKPYSLKIAIDKAKIVSTIVELYYNHDGTDGWNVSTLLHFAGHLQGTPNIGQGGNAVLAGHVELKDGSPGAFAQINLLTQGDRIFILSDDPKKPIVMQYVVTSVVTVDPNAINEIRNHGYEELTLVTCQDWDAKTNTYQKRTVIHAQPANAKAVRSVATGVSTPKRS